MLDKAAATLNAQITGFTLGEDNLPDFMHVSVLDPDKELWEVGKIPLDEKKRKLMKKLGEATKEKLLSSPIIVLVDSNGWASDGYTLVNPILKEAKPDIKEPETINFGEIPKFKVAVSAPSADNTVETPEPVAEKPKRQRRPKATPTPAEPEAQESADDLASTLGIDQEEPQGEKCGDCVDGRVPGGPNVGQTMACPTCAGEGFIKPKVASAEPAEEEPVAPVAETPAELEPLETDGLLDAPVAEAQEEPNTCPDCGGSKLQPVPGGKTNETMACLTCAEATEEPAAEPVAKAKKPKRQRKAKATPSEEPAAEPVAKEKQTKASGQTRQNNMKMLLVGKDWKIQEEGWTEEGLTSTSGFHLKHWYRIVVEETGETAVVGKGELIEYAGIKPPRKKRTTTVTTAKAGFRSFFADADGPVGKAGELPEEPTFEEPESPVAETQEEPVKPKRQRKAKATPSEEPAAEPVAEAPTEELPAKLESEGAIDLAELIRSAEESASDGVDVEDLLNPSEEDLTTHAEESGEEVDLSFIDA